MCVTREVEEAADGATVEVGGAAGRGLLVVATGDGEAAPTAAAVRGGGVPADGVAGGGAEETKGVVAHVHHRDRGKATVCTGVSFKCMCVWICGTVNVSVGICVRACVGAAVMMMMV